MIHSADVGRGVIGVMDVTNLMVSTLWLHLLQYYIVFALIYMYFNYLAPLRK